MQARGQARRAALVEAAAALLRDEGFDAVRHRAVAERAGLPLAATTYYFGSRDELLAAAFELLADRQLASSRRATAGVGGDTAAATLVAIVLGAPSPERPALLTFYERFVAAGRHPSLQQTVRRWDDTVRALLADALPRLGYEPSLAPLVLAVVDGATVAALAEGEPDPAAAANALLGQVLACAASGARLAEPASRVK